MIQLAFWSALLEQYSAHINKDGPSQRMAAITQFLEEAVRIVPIESILFAIAHSDYDTGVKCAEALLTSNARIPPSMMMVSGTQTAIARMRTGLNGVDINHLVNQSIKKLIAEAGTGRVIYALETPSSDKLEVKVIPTIVTELQYPTRMPIQVQTYAEAARQHRHSSLPQLANVSLEIELFGGKVFRSEIDLEPDPTRKTNPNIANKLNEKFNKYTGLVPAKVVCDLNIEHVYPVNTHRRHTLYAETLQSPLEVLRDSREKIATFLKDSQEDIDSSAQSTQSSNEQMLALVREISDHNLKICAALLGAFMEQQIRIPLLKSEMDTANVISEKSSPVAMGVWALFSVSYEELNAKLSSLKGSPLLVEIAGYISGILGENLQKPSKKTSNYNGKLQFLLQGIKKTVSCSSQYISYSLEHQLCSNLKFDKSTSVKALIKNWDTIFKGDALALVALSHRPLIARWLKWAVLIHDLREALAKYTCIGVIGLVNSGKSQLVSKLFGVEVCTCIAYSAISYSTVVIRWCIIIRPCMHILYAIIRLQWVQPSERGQQFPYSTI